MTDRARKGSGVSGAHSAKGDQSLPRSGAPDPKGDDRQASDKSGRAKGRSEEPVIGGGDNDVTDA